MQVRSVQGDTLDLLCHRHLGTTAGGVVERTLELNPGLADLGAVIPTGQLITLASPITTRHVNTVNLWD